MGYHHITKTNHHILHVQVLNNDNNEGWTGTSSPHVLPFIQSKGQSKDSTMCRHFSDQDHFYNTVYTWALSLCETEILGGGVHRAQ